MDGWKAIIVNHGTFISLYTFEVFFRQRCFSKWMMFGQCFFFCFSHLLRNLPEGLAADSVRNLLMAQLMSSSKQVRIRFNNFLPTNGPSECTDIIDFQVFIVMISGLTLLLEPYFTTFWRVWRHFNTDNNCLVYIVLPEILHWSPISLVLLFVFLSCCHYLCMAVIIILNTCLRSHLCVLSSLITSVTNLLTSWACRPC